MLFKGSLHEDKNMPTFTAVDKVIPLIHEQDRILSVRPHAELPRDFAPERVLSIRQAAELFGVSVATFRRLHSAGKVPEAIRLSERRIGWSARALIADLAKRAEAAA